MKFQKNKFLKHFIYCLTKKYLNIYSKKLPIYYFLKNVIQFSINFI